ncbi:MAG TPA: FtsX-like permease family protein [Candidatus Angelobacter sp.]|nr:FtsX-like permease family protein [Candidatus Angelobacter sp.]
MKIRDITIRAGRSLKQAKARTLLTSLAIGVGAFTIVLSLAVGSGGRAYTSNIISSNTNSRAIYTQAIQDFASDPTKPKKYSDTPTMSMGGGQGPSIKLLKQTDIDKITNINGVESVTPIYMFATKYITRIDQEKYIASVETFDSSVKLEYISASEGDIKDGEVIISNNYSEALGFKSAEEAIGQTIQIVVEKGGANTLQPEIKSFDFKIYGVIKQSMLAVNFTDRLQITKNDTKLLYDYNQQGSPTFNTYAGAIVVVSDNADIAVIKSNINEAGYKAQTAEDLMSFIFQFINVLQGILIGFGALAVLTSVFGIINTQYISVLERTQQIGLMKAFGMRNSDVGRLFELEAAWIGLLGGSIGSGMAVIMGTIANPFISKALNIGDVSLIIFDPLSIIAVVIGLVLVSVASGILPARKAAKLNPIEALRTE